MKILELTPELIGRFEYNGSELKTLKDIDWKSRMEVYLASGSGWCVEHNGEVIMVGGYYQISKGVAQAWMMFNQESKDHAIFMVKAIREKLEEAFSAGNHRVQTYAYKTDLGGRKYIEIMGFKYEARAEAFGPNGEDMIVYKIVRKQVK